MQHHHIVIVGGGNAGISVASQLLRKNQDLDIAIVEPSDTHYYQPAWTLVGAGIFNIKKTEKKEKDVMPNEVTWIKKKVTAFSPEKNQVQLDNDSQLSYDYLVVAPGIQLNWDEIKGLKENLGKNGVCSNYSFKTAAYTFECLKKTKRGRAIFHSPDTPVKCGGAPHKIMYLAADYFRKHNTLSSIQVEYWSGGTRLFAIPKYEKTLLNVIQRNNIQLHFYVRLVEIDGENKIAKFIGIGDDNMGQAYNVNFEMIHVTPPQSAPDFVRNSILANEKGWVDVNKSTLQHVQFPNIFSLGDASSLPTSKTGAAIRKQAPVVVANILALRNKKEMKASYNGYTSCPIVTGYGKLVLAEFDYNNKPVETFPFDQSKERWSMYQLKTKVLPWLYWNKILPGKM